MRMRLVGAVLAAVFSLHAAETAPAGKTWALLVGISQFGKLPQENWLQYPDADAKALAALLTSPRGGAVPANQMQVIVNAQATTAAIRSALQDFLKTKPGKNDTVYVLIASHGVVDNTGAYVLTYDSDPNNLSGTALPMAELKSLVNESLTITGHVIFLADVCRAATIAGQKTAAVGDAVKSIGESPGEMLGLMAARPKELSIEGPDYGGGHGAFTWSVLRALDGQADENHDGFVDIGELIDFVTTDVPKLTHDKQHPRDFGNAENTTKLADTSKPGVKL